MSSAVSTALVTSYNTFLLVPILLFFGLMTVAVLRSPSLVTSSGIGSAEIVVAPLILSTYALEQDDFGLNRGRIPESASL